MKHTCAQCGWSGVVKTYPRCPRCVAAAAKRWRQKNPEKVRARKLRYDAAFRRDRREEYNARKRRYSNPERNAEMWARRMRWLLSGDVTREQLIEVFERDRECVYCGVGVVPRFSPLDPRGFDHVIPRARGGKHTAKNIVVACRSCNAKKSDNELERKNERR